MSKLSRRGSRGGPITSTQIDGGENGNDNDEYLSREERVFKRQLEYAIEKSKNSTSDQDLNGKKRKNPDKDQVSGSKAAKSRKVSESDSDCDIDFGLDLDDQPKEPKIVLKISKSTDDSNDSFKIVNEPDKKSKSPDESTDTELENIGNVQGEFYFKKNHEKIRETLFKFKLSIFTIFLKEKKSANFSMKLF